MAYAVQLTIGTGNKVSINYQSQDVNVSLTYQLEREDADVLAVARDKAGEVAAAHRIAWERIRDEKVNGSKVGQNKNRKKKGGDSDNCEPDSTESDGGEPKSEEPSSEVNPIPPGFPSEDKVTLKVKEENRASGLSVVPLTGGQLVALEALLVQAGWSQSQLEDHLLDRFGKAELVELSAAEAAQMLLQLQRDERLKTQSRSQERHTNPARLNGHS